MLCVPVFSPVAIMRFVPLETLESNESIISKLCVTPVPVRVWLASILPPKLVDPIVVVLAPCLILTRTLC